MGIVFAYENAKLTNFLWSGLSYFSISLSLNVLLTLMIVIRLILHTRSIRTTMGISGIGGSSKAIVIILVESGALFAVSLLLVIGPWGSSTNDYTVGNFLPILSETQVRTFPTVISPQVVCDNGIGQVIAPLLVILRVANKSAFTSNAAVSGRLSSSRSWGQLVGGSDTLPGGNPSSSVDRRGVESYELGTRVATATDSHKDT